MNLEALTSAIYNNVVTGLKGTTQNFAFSLEQLEDEIVEERVTLIKEYLMKNLLPKKELTQAIRCIPVDCSDIERCCVSDEENEKLKHFELPQLVLDFGIEAIEYLGPSDGSINYKVYFDNSWKYHTKKARASNRPYVWIDSSPNSNGNYDGFIFNQPQLMNQLTVIGIFKDPRELRKYSCCATEDHKGFSFLERDIKMRLTERYFRYFRQIPTPPTPNDLTIKP